MRYILIGLMCLSAQACTKLNQKAGLKDDNLIEQGVEEAIEGVVEHYLPLDITLDFTPGSK